MFISMCLIDDGRDRLRLELPLSEANWLLSCPWSENCNLIWLQPYRDPPDTNGRAIHGLSLEETWQFVLMCMACPGGEVTCQR